MLKQNQLENRLLAALARDDFTELAAHLELVPIQRGDVIATPEDQIEHIVFPNSGMILTLADGASDRSIVVGAIGREGAGPYNVLLGSDRTPFRHMVQLQGVVARMPTAAFAETARKRPKIMEMALQFSHTLTTQLADTIAANSMARIEQRLARWLLMCDDRSHAADIAVTHIELATMLGVRRASVTDQLHILEGNRQIKSERGTIQILNRDALREIAGTCYGSAEEDYKRLMS